MLTLTQQAQLVAEKGELIAALEALEHAFGAFRNTAKDNRCMPTQRECNQRQAWAMQQARTVLAKVAA